MSQKRQANRHSGIGSLVQRRGRWYIVAHEVRISLDGTKTVKRPSKALPKEITTKAEALREFNRRATESLAGKGQHKPTSRTVKALCDAWKSDGTKRHPLALSAARQWTIQHGPKDLHNYTTPDLAAFRRVMEDSDTMTRETINAKIGWLRAIVKWGIVHGYAPPELLAKMQALPPLRAGAARTKEGKGRTPADPKAFDAAIKHLPSPFKEVLIIIRWTAARPSEILELTPSEVNVTDFPWIVTKVDHKTAGKGKARVFALPDPAEAALTPYLDRSPCFVADARPISDKRLRMALRRACKKAGVPRFAPYQLRHLRLTEIAKECGPEMAQAAAGHSSASMTLNYTKQAAEERALALAKAAALVGVE